ncbi:DegV family protein, partial [Chloroflexus sp.]
MAVMVNPAEQSRVGQRFLPGGSSTPLYETSTPSASRKVVVVIDASCEVDLATIARLGILVLPRPVQVNGRKQTLDETCTLHHTCWNGAMPRITLKSYDLGTLAQRYSRVLTDGFSVLALHLPERLDPTTRLALAARSILLAGQSRASGSARRIAVYKLAAIGQSFAFLVEAAAQSASEGMALHQLMTLLDRLQAVQHNVYLTGLRGPLERVCQPGRPKVGGWLGSEQIWTLDRADGLFHCQARRRDLAQTLFSSGGALAGRETVVVRSTHPRLLERINAGRVQNNLPPLVAEPGGLSLTTFFPGGCVELACPPDSANIARIREVIVVLIGDHLLGGRLELLRRSI